MFEELPQHDLFVRAVRDAGPLPGVRDLQVCCVGGRDEGADLEPSGEMAILRLCPRRVGGDAGALRAFLLHELTHLVVEMIAPHAVPVGHDSPFQELPITGKQNARTLGRDLGEVGVVERWIEHGVESQDTEATRELPEVNVADETRVA